MERPIAIALPLLLTVHAAGAACGAPDAATLAAVVRLTGEGVEGSGVVVAPGRVVTAAHVVEDLPDVAVHFGADTRPARVLLAYPNQDVALLAVDTGGQRPLPLGSGALTEHATVWAVGFPLGGPQVANAGEFAGWIASGELHTTAAVDYGQSGGALLACEGGHHVLAGIISGFGALDTGERYVRLDDFSISVPVQEVRYLMQTANQVGVTATVAPL